MFLHPVARQDMFGGQFIHRNVEEALNLPGVQVHGQHAVGSSHADAVGNEPRGDGHTWLIFFVAAAIGIVGDDGGDASGRCALAGVDHDEQFKDGRVDGNREGLNNEDIVAADVLVDLDEDIFVAELKDFRFAIMDT